MLLSTGSRARRAGHRTGAGHESRPRAALASAEAAQLAELLGRDLAALVADADKLDLVLAAAHFDPAEALRAGWPLHGQLGELHARAPRSVQGPRIIAFGADAHGNMPEPLRSDPDLHGGQLRVLPFLLTGDGAIASAVGARLEDVLLDLGMAKADTALCAQQAFAARIEHARYLTAHDLAAMMALQYRNAGLQALWPVLETAVLAPEREAWLDAPPEPLLHYFDGEVRIAVDPQGWQAVRQDNRFGETRARIRAFRSAAAAICRGAAGARSRGDVRALQRTRGCATGPALTDRASRSRKAGFPRLLPAS